MNYLYPNSMMPRCCICPVHFGYAYGNGKFQTFHASTKKGNNNNKTYDLELQSMEDGSPTTP